MSGNVLERVKEITYLGVVIDENLNWKKQIINVKNKISKGSYFITKIRHYVNLNTLKMLYHCLIYPHLTYCITAWGGISKSALSPIFILQKRILRTMSKSSPTTSSKPLFLKLKLLPLEFIYKLNLLLLFYKINRGKITGEYNLIPITQIHSYKTRLSTGENYYPKLNRLNIGQSTCTAQGLKLWRCVPNEIKSLTPYLFKLEIKLFLFENYKNEI